MGVVGRIEEHGGDSGLESQSERCAAAFVAAAASAAAASAASAEAESFPPPAAAAAAAAASAAAAAASASASFAANSSTAGRPSERSPSALASRAVSATGEIPPGRALFPFPSPSPSPSHPSLSSSGVRRRAWGSPAAARAGPRSRCGTP